MEAQATRIAEFQPGMISGPLQTSEYAREFLHSACGPLSYGQDEDEIDRMVAKRMQRQHVLYQPAKRPAGHARGRATRTRRVGADAGRPA